MDGRSNNKKHLLNMGGIALVIFILVIVFITAYKLISPRYSGTMLLSVTLHRGENIKEFSKKYDLKPLTTYGTKGTFYYRGIGDDNTSSYLEEVRKYPEVEDAYIHPRIIAD